MKKTILNAISTYQAKGSGWYFVEVLNLQINSNNYQTLKGSSYIKRPDKIAAKKAIASKASWRKKNHAERISDLKQYENDLNLKGITFPVKFTDIPKFEKQSKYSTN